MSVEHPDGRQLYFGVREHGMGTIMNGLSLHGLLPVGGTFLVFSDYMRGAIRLAALMGVRVIYSFTHDSVGVGEDGPTHQPVEQIAALRAMPGLQVIRPADGNETAAAWQMAVAHDGPTALVLTRQDVPTLEGVGDPALVARGGYIVRPAATPDVVLVGAGSEVQHCVGAADLLADEGISAQVVSLPCFGAFDAQNLRISPLGAAAGCARCVLRGRCLLRMGQLRRRPRLHRPIRRIGAGRRRHGRARHHRRARRRRGANVALVPTRSLT